jgi:hypothetical protein
MYTQYQKRRQGLYDNAEELYSRAAVPAPFNAQRCLSLLREKKAAAEF